MRRLLLPMLAALLLVPPVVQADSNSGTGDEARAAGKCGSRATSRIRVRDEGTSLEIRFRVDHRRLPGAWRIVMVHEGRVAWRGNRRTASNGTFELRRRVADYRGADRVMVRALGPRGVTCVASATLRG